MPITLDGTNGITTPMYNGSIAANAVTPSVNMKNRIINGAMVIDQRNAGASTTPTVGGTYNLDRWQVSMTSASKFSVQQNAGSVTPPAGFTNYLGITSLSAFSVGTSEWFMLNQAIEGFTNADLDFGKSTAKTITLSFWVRSSLTGTFGGAINNDDNNRGYPFTYTISSANTWEYKTVTIPGDTTGTWPTTNGRWGYVRFGLGVGSSFSGTAGAWTGSTVFSATGATSVVGTNGATFYITGVQLEVGSTATSFDYRPYGTELNLCQRYFLLLAPIHYFPGKQNGSTDWVGTLTVPVPLRASPTLSFSGGSSKYLFTTSGANLSTTNSITLVDFINTYVSVALTGFSGLSDNVVGNVRFDNNVLISSEL